MEEALIFGPSQETKQDDPNKTVLDIYEDMRQHSRFNNLLDAIEAGGKTIVMQTYEMNKCDPNFLEEPEDRNRQFSDDLTSLVNEAGGLAREAAIKFKEIRVRARDGKATADDAKFAAHYKNMVQEIYDKLREMGYSHEEIIG